MATLLLAHFCLTLSHSKQCRLAIPSANGPFANKSPTAIQSIAAQNPAQIRSKLEELPYPTESQPLLSRFPMVSTNCQRLANICATWVCIVQCHAFKISCWIIYFLLVPGCIANPLKTRDILRWAPKILLGNLLMNQKYQKESNGEDLPLNHRNLYRTRNCYVSNIFILTEEKLSMPIIP